MASNVRRPPRALIAHGQQNLQSTQAAHRQRLEQAVGRPVAVPPRPPQLPGSSSGGEARGSSRGGYPDHPSPSLARSLGYSSAVPRSPPGRSSSLQAGGSSSSHDPSPRASGRRSSGRSSPSARALSSPHSGARKSPHAKSSRSASPQHAALRHPLPDDAELPDDGLSQDGAGNGADSDEGFEDDLEDLALLCSHLNNHGESGLGVPTDEHRPATGGTSASASTTAPGSSSRGEGRWNDVDEFAGEGALDSAVVGDAFEDLRGAQRAHWELQRFSLPHGCRIERTDCSAAQFFFTMDVVEGPYMPATLVFWIKVFEEFPNPGSFSVRSTKRIFHPNVDPELGTLVLDHFNPAGDANTMRAILLAIRTLVCTPAESPALNRDAVKLLQSDTDEFRRVVRSTLSGLEHRGTEYEQLLNVGKHPGKKAPLAKGKAAAAPPRSAATSHAFKVDMMDLETMADHMKVMTQHWQDLNTLELRRVENLLDAQRLGESCLEDP